MRKLKMVCDKKSAFLGVAEDKVTYLNPGGDLCRIGHGDFVTEIEVPDWLTAGEFAKNAMGWRVAWEIGVDKNWARTWQEFLVSGTKGAVRFGIIRLLKTTNFRSSLNFSAHSQLVEWLETEPKLRNNTFPLSKRQLDFIVFEMDGFTSRRAEAKARADLLNVNVMTAS